jgi:class 3 adenylate cyclase
MDEHKLEIECMVHAQSFETLWAYYSQSSGNLFDDETRQAARAFMSIYDDLAAADAVFADPNALAIGEDTDVKDMVNRLREWAESSADWPWEEPFQSRFMLWAFITGLNKAIGERIGLSRLPAAIMSTEEIEYSESYIKWSGHLPRIGLRRDPDKLVEEASSADTIVVVGDIRRSQDLMTYAADSEEFSTRMVEFLSRTRQNLEINAGFFDKFTGDGFVAYFNQAICNEANKDHIQSFLDFAAIETSFAFEHFSEWQATIRKVPGERMGLALGADLGVVAFHSIRRHLVAVGDPIVWAARMASAASAGQLLINNLLYHRLSDRPELSLEEFRGATKTGESFLARVLDFSQDAGGA